MGRKASVVRGRSYEFTDTLEAGFVNTVMTNNSSKLEVSEKRHESLKNLCSRLNRHLESILNCRIAQMTIQAVFNSTFVPHIVSCKSISITNVPTEFLMNREQFIFLSGMPPQLPPFNEKSLLLPVSWSEFSTPAPIPQQHPAGGNSFSVPTEKGSAVSKEASFKIKSASENRINKETEEPETSHNPLGFSVSNSLQQGISFQQNEDDDDSDHKELSFADFENLFQQNNIEISDSVHLIGGPSSNPNARLSKNFLKPTKKNSKNRLSRSRSPATVTFPPSTISSDGAELPINVLDQQIPEYLEGWIIKFVV